MNGNLAEWTNDWYAEDYYYGSPVDNPLGPGSGKYRVIRGGSFRSRPKEDFFTKRGKRIRKRETWLAVEVRDRLKPHQIKSWVGFRPARTAIFSPVEYIKLPSPLDKKQSATQVSRSRTQILNKNSGANSNQNSRNHTPNTPGGAPPFQNKRQTQPDIAQSVEQQNQEIQNSSPYIYSLDPNYTPQGQAHR